MIEYVIHRVNEIEKLRKVASKYGTEIDIRAYGSELILNHEPFQAGDRLVDFLAEYEHGLLVLNIKEAGIEDEVIRLVKSYGIKNYFLLDCEFPYIYRASRQGVQNIAMRYSEDEAIETVLNYKSKVNWVWIDTNTRLPLNDQIIGQLEGLENCLVCPERWGRPQDIFKYAQEMIKLNFKPTAIMTSLDCVSTWEKAWE